MVRGAAANVRIFTFGIGTDVNAHLLDRIASETRAASQYVLPKEDIEVKVSSFFSKIRDPVLTNLAITFTNPSIRVTQLQPSIVPDLFNGDMLTVFGRYYRLRRGGGEDNRNVAMGSRGCLPRMSASRHGRQAALSSRSSGQPVGWGGSWTR